jgi:hypothetical protein
LAIGAQTRDTAQLKIDSDGNTQTYLGNAGANCEGLFSNQTGGNLTWTIKNNVFAHGIGGNSCNGAEFFVGSGAANSTVSISKSSFVDNAGDMIEQNNLGNGTMTLSLDRVTVSHTSLATKLPALAQVPAAPGFATFTNRGYCLSMFTTGPGSTNKVSISNSELSDCEADGIGAFFANYAGFGTGAGNEVSLEISNTTISNVKEYPVRWLNYAQLNKLTISVKNSLFTGSASGSTMGFFQTAGGVTSQSTIDLGGGPVQGSGGNCIGTSAPHALEIIGYDVKADSNWWGVPGAPAAGTLSVTSGTLTTLTPLAAVPGGCGFSPG